MMTFEFHSNRGPAIARVVSITATTDRNRSFAPRTLSGSRENLRITYRVAAHAARYPTKKANVANRNRTSRPATIPQANENGRDPKALERIIKQIKMQ